MRFTGDVWPGFNPNNLTLTVTDPPLKIVGGFMATPPPTSYYGIISVQVTPFGFQALGGYTPSTESIFLYARVTVPLGGPPFLFVTGLAGGFGLNSQLHLPTFANLSSYLFLPGNAPPAQKTPALTMANVLPQFDSTFTSLEGEYWIAAGVQFTSFEMIDSFALVTVAFGVDLQVALMGTCSMTLPKGEPMAYIEVDLLASFTAATGLFAVMGKLSPASFLYGGFVRLSGGFAFFIWVSGTTRGNFVVSLGGYSTSYVKPNIYPAVPRLGVSFGLGPFQALGQSYFALLPSMMMAGISVSVTWSAGPIRVWLDMGVEFMIGWAPLQYAGYAYVAIGCSLDLGLFTIKIQIGADLTLWGPAFGGRAVVDLDVVKFTIGFGSSSPPAVPPLGWAGFRNALLSATTPDTQLEAGSSASPSIVVNSDVIKASAPEGVVQSGVTGSDGQYYDWVLRPNGFAILTNSSVPANSARWGLSSGQTATIPNTVSSYNSPTVNTEASPYLELAPGEVTFSPTQVWNPDLSIAPMALTCVQSFHVIAVNAHLDTDPAGTFSQAVTSLLAEPQMMGLNAAMWAPRPQQHTADEPAMVNHGLTGFLLKQIPRTPDHTSAVPLLELLFEEGNATGFDYTGQQVSTAFAVASSLNTGTADLSIGITGDHIASFTEHSYVLAVLGDAWVTSQRSAVLNDLVSNGFKTCTPAQINVAAFSTSTALNDWPGVALLGAE
jgi:hypothetical protein